MNVSSGLAFVPLPISPFYCATKAGLHSFTESLRVQLKNTKVKVFELAPPATQTELLGDFNSEDMKGVSIMKVELLSELTAENWQFSLGSKLMGQISLVQEAIPFINERGSFTLVSGVLNEEPIFAGVAGATVSGALEGFVRAAAVELPKGLRINVVNPTILKESEAQFGPFFPGVIPVEGWRVAQAYKRAILGVQTGRVYKVD